MLTRATFTRRPTPSKVNNEGKFVCVDCMFKGNAAFRGGGVFSYAAIDTNNIQNTTLIRPTFVNNTCTSPHAPACLPAHVPVRVLLPRALASCSCSYLLFILLLPLIFPFFPSLPPFFLWLTFETCT